jgi:Domain of unknown function (DUF4349)
MEPFEDDRLVAALESLRPAPRPAFAAELDERAGAGFPRRSRIGGSPLARLAGRLRAIEPRRVLVPAGATALAAVAAVTVVVAVSENGGPSSMSLNSSIEDSARPPARSGRRNSNSAFNYHRAGSNLEYEAASPSVARKLGSGEGTAASSAGSAAQMKPFSQHSDVQVQPQVQPLSRSGPYASRAAHREIERSAQMVLGAGPAEVRKAASEVFETVHAYRGIVLSSSIRDGGEGEAGARFELLIPSARLGDALAAFSGIAEVRSRHEATADITAPTVRIGEQLRDSHAKVESLLAQLSNADTTGERVAAEVELRAERQHNAYLRSQLSSLQRRANLSRVDLRIESGAPTTSSNETGWSINDALGDAGHILAIAAGVTIVGFAILGPLALIALLAWLANRTRIRRARRRALA